MRYRFSKDEISICGGYGDLTLSIILDGEYKSCSYLGYSTQEAIRKFQQDFGTYPKNYIPVGTLPINNFGGIAVMEIENGIEDYVYVTDNFGNGYTNLTKNKIHYNKKGEPYFVRYGNRYYLHEFAAYYSDKIYGGKFTYDEMVEDAKKNYDYGDPTNCLTYQKDWWKENYKVVQ